MPGPVSVTPDAASPLMFLPMNSATVTGIGMVEALTMLKPAGLAALLLWVRDAMVTGPQVPVAGTWRTTDTPERSASIDSRPMVAPVRSMRTGMSG